MGSYTRVLSAMRLVMHNIDPNCTLAATHLTAVYSSGSLRLCSLTDLGSYLRSGNHA